MPLYGQEVWNWCGAGSVQMVRDGYPNPADRLFYTQTALWNTIKTFNSNDPTDVAEGWASDPEGVVGCLQSLSNPAGVHWSKFIEANRDNVLFNMLFWMNRRDFPSAVLINQGGHWNVIVGFTTDIEPVAGSTPVLQTITVHDPWPVNVGTDTQMSGSQWFNGPWNGGIYYPGTWQNKYVAIVEPPVQEGRVKVKRETRTGKKLLSGEEALRYARRWIADRDLAAHPKYSILRREDVIAREPMLVREISEEKDENVPHYYIVPFGFKEEVGKCGTFHVRVAVLVNAYTGNFEEVTAFGKPVRYLPEDEALQIVASAMRVERKKLAKADIRLAFQPSDITHIRSWPFWKVTINKRTVYVDMTGKIHGSLHPSVPGD